MAFLNPSGKYDTIDLIKVKSDEKDYEKKEMHTQWQE